MSNITVCARFRPLSTKEKLDHGDSVCIQAISDETFILKDEKEGEFKFIFDRTFYEKSEQDYVYSFLAQPIVQDAVKGINGTIITYGQTGAGKTFSMEGPNILSCDEHKKGLLARAVSEMFELIASCDKLAKYTVKLSMVEIYMEKVRDLFDLSKDNIQIKETKSHGLLLHGVSELSISSPEEALQHLSNGLVNRAVGETQMNMTSSRSHCLYIFTIQLELSENKRKRSGKLILVDLAGSEKVEKTGAEGRVLEEAKTINKSLSSLGNVVYALTSSPSKGYHIPYRDSKLTRILQDGLGGNSRTALLCCCSPSPSNASESLSTLRFGARAKHIKASPRVSCFDEKPAKALPAFPATKEESHEVILNKSPDRLDYEGIELLEDLEHPPEGTSSYSSSVVDLDSDIDSVSVITTESLQEAAEELACLVEQLARQNIVLETKLAAIRKFLVLHESPRETTNFLHKALEIREKEQKLEPSASSITFPIRRPSDVIDQVYRIIDGNDSINNASARKVTYFSASDFYRFFAVIEGKNINYKWTLLSNVPVDDEIVEFKVGRVPMFDTFQKPVHAAKIRWANESISALLLGLLSGGVVLLLSNGHSSHLLSFSEDLFFLYLLPPIIFNAGFQVKKKQFFKNFTTILLFGVLGTVISFCLISLGVFFLFKKLGVTALGVQDYLALGAILSATDTVCTLQVLSQEETPFLYSVVFGEGVVNDATSIVLFNAVQSLDFRKISGITALELLGTFIYLFTTSTLLGIAAGLLSAYIIKTLYFGRHSTDREVALMLLMAYLSYMLAEFLDLSGIMTIFFCGIVMSHYTWHNITESSRITTKHAFATLSFVAENFIFLYLGMDALDVTKWKDTRSSILTSVSVSATLLALVLLGRAAFIFPLTNIRNFLKRKSNDKIEFRQQFIMWWAGLMRGAVTIALSYSEFSKTKTTSTEDSALTFTCVIIIVLFSTTVFGLITKPLIEAILLRYPRRAVSNATDEPSLEDLGLLFLEIGDRSHEGNNQRRRSSLSLLIKYPTSSVHYLWRKFDDRFMRPVFGGRGFAPFAPGSPSEAADDSQENH